MLQNLKNIGPGALVAAAFIGPGTVTTCSIAGASYGYTLLWAVALSILCTLFLQEMSMRLGIVKRMDLAMALRNEIKRPVLRFVAVGLTLIAIVLGNMAYEAGNISGAVLGFEPVFGSGMMQVFGISFNSWSIVIGLAAMLILFSGTYKRIEAVLIAIVIFMSLSFVITAVITRPDLSAVLNGLFRPGAAEGSFLTIMAVIGTTVVPYNLFLHANLVREKWSGPDDLPQARFDTIVSILAGGVVSLCIVAAAAASGIEEITGAANLATGLEPLFGSHATLFMALGLFAAGITSAVTAPLAAAYVAMSCVGREPDLRSGPFRSVWMMIILTGIAFSAFGTRPVELIQLAQVANAVLLPVMAGFLIWATTRKSLMGDHINKSWQNIAGALIFAISLLLSLRVFWSLWAG